MLTSKIFVVLDFTSKRKPVLTLLNCGTCKSQKHCQKLVKIFQKTFQKTGDLNAKKQKKNASSFSSRFVQLTRRSTKLRHLKAKSVRAHAH